MKLFYRTAQGSAEFNFDMEKFPLQGHPLMVVSHSMEIDITLLEKIRLSTPGPVARHLNKRISLPISVRLARWGVHPNAITFFNMIFGISTGFFVAQGTYLSMLLGGFLFQMASIFDGCDGEVAKLTNKTSKLGQWLDTLSDNGALLSFLAGLMIAFAKSHSEAITGVVAFLLITGVGGIFLQVILFLKKETNSASLLTFDKEYLSKLPLKNGSFLMITIRYGRILMRKDVFSLLFFVAALFGILPLWFYIAAVGTFVANGILIWLKIKQSSFSTSTAPSSIQWND